MAEIEPELIAEYPMCRVCGSRETVAKKACHKEIESGKYKPDHFFSLSKEVTPIEEPMLAIAMVRVIVVHKDACLNCGEERITKVEVVSVPAPSTMRNASRRIN